MNQRIEEIPEDIVKQWYKELDLSLEVLQNSQEADLWPSFVPLLAEYEKCLQRDFTEAYKEEHGVNPKIQVLREAVLHDENQRKKKLEKKLRLSICFADHRKRSDAIHEFLHEVLSPYLGKEEFGSPKLEDFGKKSWETFHFWSSGSSSWDVSLSIEGVQRVASLEKNYEGHLGGKPTGRYLLPDLRKVFRRDGWPYHRKEFREHYRLGVDEINQPLVEDFYRKLMHRAHFEVGQDEFRIQSLYAPSLLVVDEDGERQKLLEDHLRLHEKDINVVFRDNVEAALKVVQRRDFDAYLVAEDLAFNGRPRLKTVTGSGAKLTEMLVARGASHEQCFLYNSNWSTKRELDGDWLWQVSTLPSQGKDDYRKLLGTMLDVVRKVF